MDSEQGHKNTDLVVMWKHTHARVTCSVYDFAFGIGAGIILGCDQRFLGNEQEGCGAVRSGRKGNQESNLVD